MSWNPSSNEEDTIGARWHDDVNLEVLIGWHVFAYLCTLLGYSTDVFQTSMDDGDPHDVDMELEVVVYYIFMMMHLSIHICK